MFAHEIFESQVEETPDRVALVFEGQSLTYRELDGRANQLARRLRVLGVGPEAPVGVCMERSPELVVAILGLLKADGAYLPLDPTQPKERLSFILNDTRPAAVLAQKRLVEFLPQHTAPEVCLDSDWNSVAEESSEPLETKLNDGNLGFLIYTSGSTGEPKAVMLPNRKRENRESHENTVYQMTRDDRHVLKSSISFTLLTREVFWPLLTGAQLFITPPGTEQDSAYLAKFIAANKITIITLTPSMLGAFLEEPEAKNCPSLRHVVCFGETLTPELQRRFFSRLAAELSMYYGSTEAPSATLLKCRREDVSTTVQLGHPLPGKQVYLLSGGLQPVPIGVCGELYIGGKLARGYFKRPDLTAERFIPDPFSPEPGARLYRTGDLGRCLAEGSIEFLGRDDEQVKIRGFRIELGEIEAVLRQHTSIRQAVVVAREDRVGESRLVAYIVLEEGKSVTDLRNFLRTKLSEYMLPSRFVFLAELPLTSNGKVDRRSLPAPDQTNTNLAKSFVASRDELELRLVWIWERVLGTKPIGVRDDFFELGGDSLLAARLFARLEKLTSKRLPLALLFQAPTIEQLAGLLRDTSWSPSWSSLVAIQPNGSKPPFFCVHAHRGNVLNFNALARHLGTEQPFYGLQARGLDGSGPGHSTIEEMAAHYIDEIRSVQPSGPYLLGGYCFGGKVAFEMAQQLKAQHEEVALLALIDSYAPGHPRRLPWRQRSKARAQLHWSNLKNLGRTEKLTYLRVKGKTAEAKALAGMKRLAARAYLALGVSLPSALPPVKRRNLSIPSIYSGKIDVFAPSQAQSVCNLYQSHMGWDGLAAGLETHVIRGKFAAIIVEPAVQELAERLRAAIDRAIAKPEAINLSRLGANQKPFLRIVEKENSDGRDRGH
jgi:amino acid adenylation domain-containing protein